MSKLRRRATRKITHTNASSTLKPVLADADGHTDASANIRLAPRGFGPICTGRSFESVYGLSIAVLLPAITPVARVQSNSQCSCWHLLAVSCCSSSTAPQSLHWFLQLHSKEFLHLLHSVKSAVVGRSQLVICLLLHFTQAKRRLTSSCLFFPCFYDGCTLLFNVHKEYKLFLWICFRVKKKYFERNV